MDKVTSIEAMLLKIQLRWVGHVSRMEVHRLPIIITSNLGNVAIPSFLILKLFSQ